MNPKYGLIGILAIAGVILLFGRCTGISLRSGEMYDASPEVQVCGKTPRWFTRVFGVVFLIAASVVAYLEFMK